MHPVMPRGLYAITPDTTDTPGLLALVTAALEGGAVTVQYRNKNASAMMRRDQATVLAVLCKRHGVPLIVNDDVMLALETGADGAHLGADDGDLARARRMLGTRRILGASCYDRLDLAQQAVAAGADYVAFGSFFPSPTKPAARSAAPHLIRQAKTNLGVPVAAIGGIRQNNAVVLIEAGADWLCVLSALFDAPDVRGAARGFAALFAGA